MSLPKIDDFDLLEIIGTGSYSTVHRARNKVRFNKCFLCFGCIDWIIYVFAALQTVLRDKMCCKVQSITIRHRKSTARNKTTKNIKSQAHRGNDRFSLGRKVSWHHSNSIELNNTGIKQLYLPRNIYIVMELCNAGNLSTYIKRHQTLPESTCKFFMRQLALAIKYMRSNNVSHFDLKPHNLLLTKSPNLTLKVADFG